MGNKLLASLTAVAAAGFLSDLQLPKLDGKRPSSDNAVVRKFDPLNQARLFELGNKVDSYLLEQHAEFNYLKQISACIDSVEELINTAEVLSRRADASSASALASQQRIADQLDRYGQETQELYHRTSALQGRLDRAKRDIESIAEMSQANRARLKAIAAYTMDEVLETMQYFIGLTDDEMQEALSRPLGEQFRILADIQERSNKQLAMALGFYSQLEDLGLLDPKVSGSKKQQLKEAFEQLGKQNRDLILSRMELSEQQFCSAMTRRGVPMNVAQFYYKKGLYVALVDQALSEESQAELPEEVKKEIKAFRDTMADISFEDNAEQKLAGLALSPVAVRRILAVVGSIVRGLPKSDQRRETSEEQALREKIAEDMKAHGDFSDCLNLGQALDLCYADVPTDPIKALSGPRFKAVVGTSEKLIAGTQRCCAAYNNGSIKVCNNLGIINESSDSKDSLDTEDKGVNDTNDHSGPGDRVDDSPRGKSKGKGSEGDFNTELDTSRFP